MAVTCYSPKPRAVVGTRGFGSNLAANLSEAGGLQTSLRGCEKSQSGALLITSLEANTQEPKERTA